MTPGMCESGADPFQELIEDIKTVYLVQQTVFVFSSLVNACVNII